MDSSILSAGPVTICAVTLDKLTLEAIEYQAEDGMAGVVGGTLRLQGQLDLSGDQVAFNLSGQAGAAEALLQSWYGNLAALPLHFTARGRWLGDRHRLELAAADLDLAGLVKSQRLREHCLRGDRPEGQGRCATLAGGLRADGQGLGRRTAARY